MVASDGAPARIVSARHQTLIADGWQYRDLPRMTEEAMENLMGIIGSENVRWLTQARYETENGVAVRGQCLISPAGFERMKAWPRVR